MDIIRRDLKDMDITWDEAEELATDRAECRQRVAQCIHVRDELRSKVRIIIIIQHQQQPISSNHKLQNNITNTNRIINNYNQCALLHLLLLL